MTLDAKIDVLELRVDVALGNQERKGRTDSPAARVLIKGVPALSRITQHQAQEPEAVTLTSTQHPTALLAGYGC